MMIKFNNLYFNYKVLQSTACSNVTASQVITLQLDRNAIVTAEILQVHLEIIIISLSLQYNTCTHNVHIVNHYTGAESEVWAVARGKMLWWN